MPILDLLGFNPADGEYNTTALVIVYIALPVLVKLLAAVLLWFVRIEAERPAVNQVLRLTG